MISIYKDAKYNDGFGREVFGQKRNIQYGVLLMNGIYWALSMEVPQGGALAEPKGELAGWEAPNTH